MKKTAVVFGSSDKYAIGCCVNIMALEKKSPNLADKYIVYYDNWDKEFINNLQAFSPKVELIEFIIFKCSTCDCPELFYRTKGYVEANWTRRKISDIIPLICMIGFGD